MNVNKIPPKFSVGNAKNLKYFNKVPARFTIEDKKNKDIKFLYNDLNKAVSTNHTTAVFKSDVVEITASTLEQKIGVLGVLKDIKAKFTLE